MNSPCALIFTVWVFIENRKGITLDEQFRYLGNVLNEKVPFCAFGRKW